MWLVCTEVDESFGLMVELQDGEVRIYVFSSVMGWETQGNVMETISK